MQLTRRQSKTLKILKQELVDFKTDVFYRTDKGVLRQKIQTMEDAVDLMTCKKVGPMSCQDVGVGAPPPPAGTVVDGKFHPYRCCLGRCEECPSLSVNRGEQYFDPPEDPKNSRTMIVWRKHEHRYWCKLHGNIDSGVCKQCEALPEKNRPTDKPRKTYDPVK